MPQSIVDKVQMAGEVEWRGQKHFLTLTSPPADVVTAKAVLMTLCSAEPGAWEVEIQDSMLAIWSGMHPTFGYRMQLRDVGKGMSKIKRVAHEMVARIKAGAC